MFNAFFKRGNGKKKKEKEVILFSENELDGYEKYRVFLGGRKGEKNRRGLMKGKTVLYLGKGVIW